MSLTNQIAASTDEDLKERLTAAYEAGIFNPDAWVAQNRRPLACAKVAEEGDDTVASVFAYAVATYGGRPGQDPSKVTDDQLRHAVRAVLAQQEGAAAQHGETKG